MKYLFSSVLVGVITFSSGCSTSEKDTILVVTVSYAGTSTISATAPIRVEVYTSEAAVKAGTGKDSGFYGDLAFSESSGSLSAYINPGTYYFLVYADKNNDSYLSSGEPYIIYNGKTKTGIPDSMLLEYNTTSTLTMSFNDANIW